MPGYVNNPAASLARRPRTLLMLGDQQIDFESIEVMHSGVHQAGTFSAVIPSRPGNDIGQWGWWFSQGVIILDVYSGFPSDVQNFSSDSLTRLCKIRVDEVQLEAGQNRIHVGGRDLSAILIDKKTDGQFQNQTSSQVAQQFAAAAGLNAQIQTTNTKIGTFYSQDYVHVAHEHTEWALLVYLARKEGFDVYVLGDTLYFGQFGNSDNSNYLIQFTPADQENASHQCNAMRLDFSHDLTLARDVIVTVLYHNTKTGKASSVKVRSSGGQAKAVRGMSPILPTSAADAQNYVYTFHNLSPQQAMDKATQLAQEIARHELNMEAELPGDDLLYPWVPIEIQGTGTVFDQTFYPSAVERRISPDTYTMMVTAKNHPTGTEASLD